MQTLVAPAALREPSFCRSCLYICKLHTNKSHACLTSAMSRSIRITRVVPTEDGGSRFVEDTRELTHETAIGALSEREKVAITCWRIMHAAC